MPRLTISFFRFSKKIPYSESSDAEGDAQADADNIKAEAKDTKRRGKCMINPYKKSQLIDFKITNEVLEKINGLFENGILNSLTAR